MNTATRRHQKTCVHAKIRKRTETRRIRFMTLRTCRTAGFDTKTFRLPNSVSFHLSTSPRSHCSSRTGFFIYDLTAPLFRTIMPCVRLPGAPCATCQATPKFASLSLLAATVRFRPLTQSQVGQLGSYQRLVVSIQWQLHLKAQEDTHVTTQQYFQQTLAVNPDFIFHTPPVTPP